MEKLIYPINNYRILEWRGQLNPFPSLTRLTPCYNLRDISGYKMLIKSMDIYFYYGTNGNFALYENLGAGDDLQDLSRTEFAYKQNQSDYFTGGYFGEIYAMGSVIKLGSAIMNLPAQKTNFNNLNLLVNSPVNELLEINLTAELKSEVQGAGYSTDANPFVKVVMETYIFQGAYGKEHDPYKILR